MAVGADQGVLGRRPPGVVPWLRPAAGVLLGAAAAGAGIRLRSATTDEDPLVLLDTVLGTPENLGEWEQALFECSAAMAPTPVPRWLRAHVARSASAFGGLVELAHQCRRMVRVLEDLDVVCPSASGTSDG